MTIIRWGAVIIGFIAWQSAAQVPVDPTRPQLQDNNMLPAENVNLHLSAILISNNAKQAIINGESYMQGQVVAGFTVLLIKSDRVDLSGPQGRQSLYINNNNFKKEVKNGF